MQATDHDESAASIDALAVFDCELQETTEQQSSVTGVLDYIASTTS